LLRETNGAEKKVIKPRINGEKKAEFGTSRGLARHRSPSPSNDENNFASFEGQDDRRKKF
jgi:hypothetical protein